MVEVAGYQIERVLRMGGMSIVYRAIAEDGRRVALKVLSTEISRGPAKSRFVREAATARTLDHPNIVRVLGFGATPAGGLFLAMELLEGEDLAERLWRGPLEIDEVMRVGVTVAGALDAVHGAGIVHRDVKPANVFLCRDGTIKLLDFGLALVASTSRLTDDGTSLGTPAYMAPEQAAGLLDIDARTDVWGLGATLYRAVSGRVPFEARSPTAQLARIMVEEPDPLPAFVPAWMRGVLLLALDRDRDRRWQSAGEMGRALLESSEAAAARPTSPDPSLHDDPPTEEVPIVRIGAALPRPLVGRDPELGALQSALRLCQEEPQATAVLLLGPAGVGKSRLCGELIATPRGAGVVPLVLEGRGEPQRSPRPWGVVAAALRRWMASARPDEPLLRADGLHHPLVAPLLGETTGRLSIPASSRPSSDPLVKHGRVLLALGDLFDELTRHAPVILLVEDLQWVDGATLELLETLPRRLERRPLFILATARAEPSAVFAEFRRIRLAGLSRAATRRLVASILGERAAADHGAVSDAIHGRAGGNPFFAEELAVAVQQGRAELPSSIEVAVRARLDALPAADRVLLDLAAVLGAGFSREALSALGTKDPEESLQRLEREEILVAEPSARRAGEQEWSFRHVVVQEVLYALLSSERRAALHRKAAAWWSSRPDALPLEIARHLHAAGATHEASIHWRNAAQAAFQDGDAAGALEATEHALPGLVGPSGFRLRMLRIEVLSWLGKRHEERAELERLEGLAATPEQRATLSGVRARSLRLEGRYPEATAAIDVGLSARPTDAGLRIELALVRAALGQSEAAIEEARRAVEAEEAAADPLLRGRALAALAMGETIAGDLAAAAGLYERARAAYDEAGDPRRAAGARIDIAYCWVVSGRAADAARLLEDIRETCRAVGSLSDEAYALQNLGLARARAGDVARGLAAQAEALAIARDLGEPRLELGCLLYRATSLAEAGRPHEALDALDEAATRHPERHGAIEPDLRALRASVLVALGQPDLARVQALHALQSRARGAGPSEHEAAAFLAAHETGVAGALAQGVTALLSRAARISDAGVREGFLRANPAHVRLLNLGRAAGLVP